MIIHNGSGISFTQFSSILFDFDGTLANTKPAIIAVATRILSEFGVPTNEINAKVNDIVGPPFPDAFSLVFGLSPLDANEVTRRYRSIYVNLGADAWPLFDGIPQLLCALHASGKRIAVASSKRQPLIERGVADGGITHVIDAVVGKIDGQIDTKEEAIGYALKQLGVDGSQTVMVGDRSFDVIGATSFGIPCIGVLYGNTGSREELLEAGAITVVDTVSELGELLLSS